MSKKDQALRQLVKELGENYCIRNIDGEMCPYRDFGNGFNVEISGMHTASLRKTANIYLWFGNTLPTCMTVKKVWDVPRDKIGATVDELYAFSERLLAEGFDTREKLFNMNFPEAKLWNTVRGGSSMMYKFFYGSRPKFSPEDRKLFSRGKYECKALFQKQDGKPVIISQCKDTEYPSWRIDYDFSSIFFATYDEVMAYCRGRFVDLDGKAV